MGLCYKYGNGVPLDKYKAVKWFEKAAQQGNEGAIDELVKMRSL
jgi:TPR repeat protein